MLGRVPDDGHDHRGDEEVAQVSARGERFQRVHEDLGDEGGDRGCRGKDAKGEREGPGGRVRRFCRDVQPSVTSQRKPCHGQVDDEQDTRDRQGEDGDRVALRVAAPRRHGWNEKEEGRQPDEGE